MYHNRSTHSHKVFKAKVSKGKNSTGWFCYGFKSSLVVNVFGQIIKVLFITANVAGNNEEHMCKFFDKSKKAYEK